MSVEIKKLDVSSIIPTQPPGPSGSYYYSIAIPSTTADGYVYYSNSDWPTCHDASTGHVANSTNTPGSVNAIGVREASGKKLEYRIIRSFLYFDMSAIPAGVTVLSGTLRMHTYDYATNVPPNQWADSVVSAQQGTQAATLTTADYDAFTGPEFGYATWKKYNVNYIELNQDGLDYLTTQIGSEAKICLRERVYDYLNPPKTTPPADTNFYNGMFYREAETYDFYSGFSIYHREYVPFLHVYYRYDWEDSNPGTTTGSKWMYALDGPTAWKTTNWNHDLRIGYSYSGYTESWAEATTSGTSMNYGDNAIMRVQARTDSNTKQPVAYRLARCHLAFDLAEITDNHEIATAYIRIRSRGYSTEIGDPIPRVDVYQGTWDYTPAVADFNSFTGGSFLTTVSGVEWEILDSYMNLTFNQDGLDYLNNNRGNIIYFCLREVHHDVADVAPVGYDQYYDGSFYGTGQGADSTYDPALYVTYTK